MKILGGKIGLIAAFGIAAVFLAAVIGRKIALDFATEAIKDERYAEAVPRLKILAQLGDSTSQRLLGDCFAFGLGVQVDDQEAVRLYARAARWSARKDASAGALMFYVGKRYLGGSGVKRDEAAARRWFERAQAEGYLQAGDELRLLHRQT